MRNLLSPPVGASTNPRINPTYSVKTTVISSTGFSGLPNSSINLCLLARSCLQENEQGDWASNNKGLTHLSNSSHLDPLAAFFKASNLSG